MTEQMARTSVTPLAKRAVDIVIGKSGRLLSLCTREGLVDKARDRLDNGTYSLRTGGVFRLAGDIYAEMGAAEAGADGMDVDGEASSEAAARRLGRLGLQRLERKVGNLERRINGDAATMAFRCRSSGRAQMSRRPRRRKRRRPARRGVMRRWRGKRRRRAAIRGRHVPKSRYATSKRLHLA